VVSNNDDGFEFFGGTVNTKYLVSAFNKDDSFDIDEGHQGKHQFWFAIQNNTTTATYGDNLMELDGGFTPPLPGPPTVDQTNNNAPFTTPDIYNFTLIGKGIDETTSVGLRMRDNFKGKLHNGLMTDIGLSLRGDSTLDSSPTSDLPVLNNSVLGNIINAGNGTYRVSTGSSTTNSNSIASALGLNNNTVPSGATLLTSISRQANGALDPRPLTGSVAFTHTRTAVVNTALADDISTVNYNGAFGKALWLDCWTYLAEQGVIPVEPESGVPPFADADGDGISDTLEATTALQDLGFSVGVNNVVPTNRFESLYTETSILDLVTGNQIMIQGGGNGGNTTLSLPLFRSNDLSTPWAAAPALEASFNGIGEKEFYRIQVTGAQ
jgi:hypothetical protein